MGALDWHTPTSEEQAWITAKIDAQFVDFKEHTIDMARIAGGRQLLLVMMSISALMLQAVLRRITTSEVSNKFR
ncbi:hypothetical protein [Bartonella koehlerae]|uniref:hypothetical protein n=1 Tax=Bartonella koehlerae TaxID=92181 RepID=UPI000689E3B6